MGGGTAGAAVATRLSQRLSNSTVLIIEAGPAAGDAEVINIPGFRGTAGNTIYDWNLTSVPHAAMNNRSLPLTRGHVLGGTSALNYLSWTKGSSAEYDAWETLGNPGWNWTTMNEQMMKSENFTIGTFGNDFVPAGDGNAGPIQTIIDRLTPKFEKYWFPTMANLGFRKNKKPTDGDLEGASLNPTSVDPNTYKRS